MQEWLTRFWFEGKSWLEGVLGVDGFQAHVIVGMVLFLGAAILFRRSKRGIFLAWMTVFLAQTFNEILDARDWLHWTGTVNWTEASYDFAATLFLPTAIYLLWWTYRRRAPLHGRQPPAV